MPSTYDRRLARFRRHIEAGVKCQVKDGARIYFLTLAMRYDRETGVLAVHLDHLKHPRDPMHYCVDRFMQIIRRRNLSIEYLRVVESTKEGVKNHAHIVLAVKGGDLPGEHELKNVWSHATYGTSYEVKAYPANQDVGWLTRYLSKALGSYLSKEIVDPEGLDGRCQNATPANYVSTSRGWLPEGAEKAWKRLFMENAFIWTCDRGFYHTDLGDTSVKWYAWLSRQPVRGVERERDVKEGGRPLEGM